MPKYRGADNGNKTGLGAGGENKDAGKLDTKDGKSGQGKDLLKNP